MSVVKSGFGKGVELCHSWRPTSGGDIPPGTVHAGDNIFVMRAMHEGELVPGKLAVGHDQGYIAYGGEEISKYEYEALVETCVPGLPCDCCEWVAASGGSVPKNAVIGGADGGQPLYVVRSNVDGETVVGKLFPQHGCAYFPYGGEEHRREDYEVLCFTKRHC